jgi:hypothetical protein
LRFFLTLAKFFPLIVQVRGKARHLLTFPHTGSLFIGIGLSGNISVFCIRRVRPQYDPGPMGAVRIRAIIDRQKIFYRGVAGHSGGFGDFVAKEYSGHRKRKLRAEAAHYLPYHTTGHILDIGCRFGGFLQAASEQGWEHLTLKDYTGSTPHTPLFGPLDAVSAVAEKALDLIVGLTLKGHRLKIWAETV